MATRVDADGVQMLSEVETDPESEDGIYDNLDSEDSISSREEYDDEPENDEDDNTDDESEENLDESEEESEETTTTGGRAAGRRGRGRGRGTMRGRDAGRGRAVVAGGRRGRGCGRRRVGGRGGSTQLTPKDLYKWVTVDEGRCGIFHTKLVVLFS